MKIKAFIFGLLMLTMSSCFTENRTKIPGEVDDVVKIVVADILMIDNNLDNNTNLVYDLGADELDIVEITMELEYQYDLIISDSEMENFYTIGNIVQYIENNKRN